MPTKSPATGSSIDAVGGSVSTTNARSTSRVFVASSATTARNVQVPSARAVVSGTVAVAVPPETTTPVTSVSASSPRRRKSFTESGSTPEPSSENVTWSSGVVSFVAGPGEVISATGGVVSRRNSRLTLVGFFARSASSTRMVCSPCVNGGSADNTPTASVGPIVRRAVSSTSSTKRVTEAGSTPSPRRRQGRRR